MPTSINTVTVSGNLTRDPELRQTKSGTSVCGLRMAINDRVKQGGEWVDRASFIDVTVWAGQGENVARYLEKGKGLCVTGRIQSREYEAKDGSTRSVIEIIAEKVLFMGAPSGERSGGDGFGGGNSSGSRPPAADDDDIPF